MYQLDNQKKMIEYKDRHHFRYRMGIQDGFCLMTHFKMQLQSLFLSIVILKRLLAGE